MHPRRLPDAADERHRVPRAGDGPVPARPPGAAHRVRRHRRGDPGDQRGRRRPLPAQAVGPAGGEALPGRRRAARGLAGQPATGRSPETKVVGHRWSAPSFEVRDFLARNPVPYRWYAADEPEGERLLAARRGRRRTDCRWSSPPDGERAGRARRDAELAAAVGLTTDPADRLLRPGRRRRRPGRAGRRGVRRVRGPAHGAGRAAGDRRAGRPELPDRELPRLPRRRLRRPAHRPGPPAGGQVRRRDAHRPRRRRPARPTARPGWCASPTAATIAAHAVILATGVSYRQLDAAGRRRAHRPRRLLRLGGDRGAGCAGAGRLHRRRRQLGRPGGGVLRPVRPLGARCWCAATSLERVDVALPDRAARRDRQHRRCAPAPRWSAAHGDGPPASGSRCCDDAHRRRERPSTPGTCSSSSARQPRTDWLRRRGRPRRARASSSPGPT